MRTVVIGTHPSAIAPSPTRRELYVANSDSDTVSVLDDRTGAVLRTIDLRPYAGAPIGASPNAITVSPDGETLYVANADDDDIAVVDLAAAGSAGGDHVLGLIPTAWYPDGIAIDSAGSTLFVTYMKGVNPMRTAPANPPAGRATSISQNNPPVNTTARPHSIAKKQVR